MRLTKKGLQISEKILSDSLVARDYHLGCGKIPVKNRSYSASHEVLMSKLRSLD